jgi:hypothetical protein
MDIKNVPLYTLLVLFAILDLIAGYFHLLSPTLVASVFTGLVSFLAGVHVTLPSLSSPSSQEELLPKSSSEGTQKP